MSTFPTQGFASIDAMVPPGTTVERVEQEVATPSGASATTTGSIFPAGVHRLGVTGKVTTLMTGATSFSVGDGTTADLYAAGILPAADTTFEGADHTADPSQWLPAAEEIVLTAAGGNFSGGVVTVIAHFIRPRTP